MYLGGLSVRKVCVLVMNLPRGAQTWAAVGGRGAVTAETEALWLVEHALFLIAHGQAGNKGQAPELRPFPPGLDELDAKSRFTQSRAEKFAAKHMNK